MKAPVRDVLIRGAARLQAAGIESARLDARVLLSHALGVPSDAPFAADVDADQIAAFELLVARRAAREPLAYITGGKEFWSLEFDVGRGVLVPRPETETLIEEALRLFPDASAPLRVLDIGTGSGCLLIAFLTERPHATGIGIDISEAALACARDNASRHGLDARCRFERSDPAEPRGTGREFDVILANPPYLTDEEFALSAHELKGYEPRQALAAGPDGLDGMRAFLPLILQSLSPAGLAFVEIGAGQTEKVAKIVMDTGLEVRRAIPDLSGIPRCLVMGRAGDGSLMAPLKNSVGKELATR